MFMSVSSNVNRNVWENEHVPENRYKKNIRKEISLTQKRAVDLKDIHMSLTGKTGKRR